MKWCATRACFTHLNFAEAKLGRASRHIPPGRSHRTIPNEVGLGCAIPYFRDWFVGVSQTNQFWIDGILANFTLPSVAEVAGRVAIFYISPAIKPVRERFFINKYRFYDIFNDKVNDSKGARRSQALKIPNNKSQTTNKPKILMTKNSSRSEFVI